MEVSSEILPFFERDFSSKPCLDCKNVVSRFTFNVPCISGESLEDNQEPLKDEDGDFIVKRHADHFKEMVLFLEHGISSELKLVGLQIWRGALLLADFLIHNSKKICNETVLELGAGVGLTSIVAGIYAKQVISTDVNHGAILRLLQHNLERNKTLINAHILVHELDFFKRNWPQDIYDIMRKTTVILAADVIYDNDVTDAFVKTITQILSIPPKKVLYIALEKRYVFTVSDLDVVAPCYEHLLLRLDETKQKKPFSHWKIEEIVLDFPQYFNYERVKELVMFKITS